MLKKLQHKTVLSFVIQLQFPSARGGVYHEDESRIGCPMI